MPPKNTSFQVEMKMKELEVLVYKLTYLIEPYSFLKDRHEESEIQAAPVSQEVLGSLAVSKHELHTLFLAFLLSPPPHTHASPYKPEPCP